MNDLTHLNPAILDDLRKTGDAKLVWAINRHGDTLGPVPEHVREEWEAAMAAVQT